jgi:hypothetical protein
MTEDATNTTMPSSDRGASEYRDIADALRNRVDLFGKTLAAVTTLGTTAVGLSKIGDLFPAAGNEGWVWAACIGLSLAALAAIGVAVRLMRVGRPIFIRADLDSNQDLDDGEPDAIRPVFEASAARFGYTSLLGLQERERSLRTAAIRTADSDERARRAALADEVKAEIDQALAQGQVIAIRRRATLAVSGLGAWFLYVVVIVGLITFAVGTDKVSSDRKDPIAQAKACGDARKAGATAAELGRTKDVCEGKATEPAAPAATPTHDEARAQMAAKLAAALEACAALAQGPPTTSEDKTRPLKSGECDPVRKALAAIDPTSGH